MGETRLVENVCGELTIDVGISNTVALSCTVLQRSQIYETDALTLTLLLTGSVVLFINCALGLRFVRNRSVHGLVVVSHPRDLKMCVKHSDADGVRIGSAIGA